MYIKRTAVSSTEHKCFSHNTD